MSTPVKPLGPGGGPNGPVNPNSAEAADGGTVAVAEPARRALDARRAFPRIPCRVLVDYVVDGAAYRDCIANISEGGAFVETSKALEPGSPITLSFSLFQDQQPVKVVGEVAWAGATGVGVRFRQNQAIGQFCSREEDAAARSLQGSEPQRPPAQGPWGRRASDMRPLLRPSRDSAATVPLWVALALVTALAVISRYDTNARIDAVADKVDRAAQSLVRLQSIAMAHAAQAGAATPVQTTFAPASRAPSSAPAPAPTPAPATAEPGPVQANVLVTPPAPQEQAAAERSASTEAAPVPDTIYTVEAGDNLYRIAQKFNVSPNTLTEHNGLTQPNRILVGQRIRIPK